MEDLVCDSACFRAPGRANQFHFAHRKGIPKRLVSKAQPIYLSAFRRIFHVNENIGEPAGFADKNRFIKRTFIAVGVFAVVVEREKTTLRLCDFELSARLTAQLFVGARGGAQTA